VPAQPASRSANPSDNSVQRTRSWTGMWVVIGGDVAIAAGAAIALWKVSGSANIIAILTSSFTAISTMTTAYFGIRTMSNTAQSFAPAVHAAVATVQAKAKEVADAAEAGAGGSSPTTGPPIPADPSHPTDAEIVARMAEPKE
jgi:hypothetical protein